MDAFESYKELGWCKLEGFFDQPFVDEANRRIADYVASKREEYQGRDINFTEGEILNSFHRLHDFDWITEMQTSRRMIDAVRPFLGGHEPEARGSELFAKPAKVGLASPDHQDDYYWCIEDSNALTAWIALDHCNESNGAVYYYEKTHLMGVLEHEPSYQKGSSQKIKHRQGLALFTQVQPVLRPGDVLIHHCLTVHGSSANTSDTSRRGWTMQFKSRDSKYDEFRRSRYEFELQQQIKSNERK